MATKLSYLKTKKKTDGPSYPTPRLWAAYFEINRKHSESDEMMIFGPIILLLGESFQDPKHLVRNRTHMFEKLVTLISSGLFGPLGPLFIVYTLNFLFVWSKIHGKKGLDFEFL